MIPAVAVADSDPAQLAADHPQCCGSGGEPTANAQPGWIVVHTQPNAERYATENLQQRGYACYLPMRAVRRRDPVIGSAYHIALVPLFPRYAFLWHTSSRNHWRPIRETPGVAAVLRTGNNVAYARTADITALQATEETRRVPPAPSAAWQPGSPCSLATGAFRGHPAVVLRVGCAPTATVSLVMLGALRSMIVPIAHLVPRDD